jgi:hypothetical protein
VIRAAAVAILMAGCIQVLSERGSQPIPYEQSPISFSRDRPGQEILRGTDAYLGQRPQVNAVANLLMLIEECRGTYKHLENTYNVRQCLDFLSTKQDKYLSKKAQTASRVHDFIHDYAESDGLLDRSSIITVTNNTESIAGKCDGPIIPYHIWRTGLPTWPIELFH